MKVVINNCFGGFSISKEAAEYMAELGCEVAKAELSEWGKRKEWIDYFIEHGKFPSDCPEQTHGLLEIDAKYHSQPDFYGYGSDKNYDRSSEFLVKAVEKLGQKASGQSAELKVVEIPDDVDYEIEEYDGNEHIAEKHRTWG